MTAKPKTETAAETAATPDESTRPAPVEGRCNTEITTVAGALDRCSRAEGHKGDHVSWTSHRAAVAKAKQDRAAFAAFKAELPEAKEKAQAQAAKKLAELMKLAEELGYTVTKNA